MEILVLCTVYNGLRYHFSLANSVERKKMLRKKGCFLTTKRSIPIKIKLPLFQRLSEVHREQIRYPQQVCQQILHSKGLRKLQKNQKVELKRKKLKSKMRSQKNRSSKLR